MGRWYTATGRGRRVSGGHEMHHGCLRSAPPSSTRTKSQGMRRRCHRRGRRAKGCAAGASWRRGEVRPGGSGWASLADRVLCLDAGDIRDPTAPVVAHRLAIDVAAHQDRLLVLGDGGGFFQEDPEALLLKTGELPAEYRAATPDPRGAPHDPAPRGGSLRLLGQGRLGAGGRPAAGGGALQDPHLPRTLPADHRVGVGHLMGILRSDRGTSR